MTVKEHAKLTLLDIFLIFNWISVFASIYKSAQVATKFDILEIRLLDI